MPAGTLLVASAVPMQATCLEKYTPGLGGIPWTLNLLALDGT